MPKFKVIQYYSGFCTDIVEAEDEADAFKKAEIVELTDRHRAEIMDSLENWDECDQAIELDDNDPEIHAEPITPAESKRHLNQTLPNAP